MQRALASNKYGKFIFLSFVFSQKVHLMYSDPPLARQFNRMSIPPFCKTLKNIKKKCLLILKFSILQVKYSCIHTAVVHVFLGTKFWVLECSEIFKGTKFC